MNDGKYEKYDVVYCYKKYTVICFRTKANKFDGRCKFDIWQQMLYLFCLLYDKSFRNED